MKVVFVCLFVGVLAGSNLGGQSVGEPCQKQSDFLVADVVVNPWPIVKKQNYTITMTGTFTSTQLLDTFTVGVKKDFSWTYTFFKINQNYLKNATSSFTYSVEGPTAWGSYTDQVTLHRPDYSQFACWEFSYSISL
jgi:hypothetical protein